MIFIFSKNIFYFFYILKIYCIIYKRNEINIKRKGRLMKIFIVGGSFGIGLFFVKRYVSLGNEVVICGINEEKLKKIEECNKNIKIYKVDVRNKEELKFVIDDFFKGNLDLIINFVGIYINNRIIKLIDKEVYVMIDINLIGVLNIFEVVRDVMFKNNRGYIVIILFVVGLFDYLKVFVYVRIKMIIMGVCEIYRLFFRNYNINIIIIVFGYIVIDKLKLLSEEDIIKKFIVFFEEEFINIIIKVIEEKKEKIIYLLSMKILILVIRKLLKKFLIYILMK